MATTNNTFSLTTRPQCPTILIPFEGQMYALPIQKMHIHTEINVSTAFVKITGTWKNIASYTSDCLFALPLNGTVTSIKIKVNQAQRLLESAVISKDEAMELSKEQEKSKSASGANKTSSLASPAGSATATAAGADGSGTEEELKLEKGQLPPMNYDQYMPNLFRMPITGVESTHLITVEIVCIEQLVFSDGHYRLQLPLSFNHKILPSKKTMNDVLSLECTVHAGAFGLPAPKWECKSHDVRVIKENPLVLRVTDFDNLPYFRSAPELKQQPSLSPLAAKWSCTACTFENGTDRSACEQCNTPKAGAAEDAADASAAGSAKNKYTPGQKSVDFSLALAYPSEKMLTALVTESVGEDNEGNFVLFVTPPSPAELRTLHNDAHYKRSLIFLLDRSGSMVGEPYGEATRALSAALRQLKPHDRFGVIAFDHRQEHFERRLVAATEANVQRAAEWARLYQPERGLTDIFSPLEYSITLLEKEPEDVLPMVILLTDGCVENERDICKYANARCKRTRVLSFGIGTFCNYFFLKMLSQIGRGFADVVMSKDRIYPQVVQLLNSAAVPVLTNITLQIPGVNGLEVYPFPVPDLFMGAPLTISGKYKGTFPAEIRLNGVLPDNSTHHIVIPSRASEVVPVRKVFIKQRLDLLTAKAWMDQSKSVQQEVVQMSVQESMPSAYTVMVAYETTEDKKRAEGEPDDDDWFMEESDEKEGGPSGAAAGAGSRAADRKDADDGDDVHLIREQDTSGDSSGNTTSSSSSSSSSPSKSTRKVKGGKDKDKKKKWYKNKKTVAALAVGNVLIIGTAMLSFGDLVGTSGNFGAFGEITHAVGAGGCCECCGHCDVGDCFQC